MKNSCQSVFSTLSMYGFKREYGRYAYCMYYDNDNMYYRTCIDVVQLDYDLYRVRVSCESYVLPSEYDRYHQNVCHGNEVMKFVAPYIVAPCVA